MNKKRMARKEGIFRIEDGSWEIYIDGRLHGHAMTKEVARDSYEAELDRMDQEANKDLEGKGSGRKGPSGIKMFSSVPAFFGGLLRNGLRLIFALVILAVLGGLVFIGYNYTSSGATEAWTKDVSVAFGENVPDTGFFDLLDRLLHPEKQKTYKSIVENNQGNTALGAKIVNYEATPSEYIVRNNEMPQIRSTAVVQMSSLSNNESSVIFDCELEDYDGEMFISPKNYSYFGDGSVKRQTVLCSVDRIDGHLDLSEKTLNTKTMRFDVIFDTITIAHYDAYLIAEDTFIRFEADNIDPWLHYEGQRPKELGLGDVMSSTVTPGPVNLGIGTGNNQPFVEEGEIPLQVSLDPAWKGEMRYVKDLRLKIPPEIELIESPQFCDFEFNGEYDGDYKVYHLTPYAFNELVNIDCSGEALEGTGLSEKSCMKSFKSAIQLNCPMKILPLYSSFVRAPIEAEADYVFAMEKSVNVKIRRSESNSDGGDVDPCEYYNETKCISTTSCKPVFDNEVFSSCISCDERTCEEYTTQDECVLDYCQLNNCNYETDSCRSMDMA